MLADVWKNLVYERHVVGLMRLIGVAMMFSEFWFVRLIVDFENGHSE